MAPFAENKHKCYASVRPSNIRPELWRHNDYTNKGTLVAFILLDMGVANTKIGVG